MKCQQCPQSFSDMKSLQIHTFLEHNRGPSEARNTGSPTVLNLSQQARHPSPSPDHHQQIPCQICGVKLPNQIIYQQVTKRTNMFVLSWQWNIFSILAFANSRHLPTLRLQSLWCRLHIPRRPGDSFSAPRQVIHASILTLNVIKSLINFLILENIIINERLRVFFYINLPIYFTFKYNYLRIQHLRVTLCFSKI